MSLSVLLLAGCTVSVVDYPAISHQRTPGAACFAGDDASIKRAEHHPLGPTGGWSSGQLVEAGQTPIASELGLRRSGAHLIGFLKLDEAGELRARAYDDSYGEVYCGWSPERVSITAGISRVRLGACVVGDGGLKQVDEVCWFPAGQSRGQIVYSSAHGEAKQNPAEFYRREDLGSRHYFNEHLAFAVIRGAKELGNEKLANTVINDSLAILAQQADLVDGSTGKPIPAAQHYRAVREKLLALKD